jgi:hypothetical protein
MDLKPVQHRLNELGFGPLLEDGIPGNRTNLAIKKFQFSKGLTADGIIGPKTIQALGLVEAIPNFSTLKPRVLSNSEFMTKYGPPGPSHLVIADLPFPMKVDWDRNSFTRKIQCHKLVAPHLQKVFEEILEVYGIERIKELEIDIYGGCYNLRSKRGGTSWSVHSYGAAIDLNPSKNGLHTPWKEAQFSKPEYEPMIEAFYKNGFINLGKEQNFDPMHFQIGI